MWKNTLETDKPRMAIRRTSIAYIIPKATDTHSRNEIFIFSTAIMVTPIPHSVTGIHSLRERDHWGDPNVDGRIILRGIFRKWERIVGTGWSGLRIGTGGGHL
jgi:hypothetical protein